MILASESGLPVDIRNAPIPPQVGTSTAALKPSIVSKIPDVNDTITGNIYLDNCFVH